MLDPEFDENREDINSSVQRFEKMLNNQEDSFFDIDTLEQIADHYFMQSKFDEALKACDLGLTHFPYTLELIILKAQVLGEIQKPEDAWKSLKMRFYYFLQI